MSTDQPATIDRYLAAITDGVATPALRANWTEWLCSEYEQECRRARDWADQTGGSLPEPITIDLLARYPASKLRRYRTERSDAPVGRITYLVPCAPQVDTLHESQALRARGFWTKALIRRGIDATAYAPSFDEVVVADGVALTIHELEHDPADLIHALNQFYNLTPLVRLFTDKPLVTEVYDFDPFRHDGRNDNAHTVEAFAWSLTDTDGLKYKDSPLAPDIMRNELGIEVVDRRLQFWPYFPTTCSQPARDPSDPLRLVTAGMVGGRDAAWVAPTMRRSFRQLTGLGELHVYASPFFAEDADDVDAIDGVHLHEPILGNGFIDALSQYDVGVIQFPYVSPMVNEGLTCAVGSKLMAFVAAGLPTLVSEECQYMSLLVERLGIGWSMPSDQVAAAGELIRRTYRDRLHRVAELQPQWRMDANIDRLIDFYRRCGMKTACRSEVTS